MVGKRSRYAVCALVREGLREYLGTRPPLEIKLQPDDRFHEVIAGERLDQLAYKYLGDPRLWWVIVEANDIAWPLDLEPGTVLRIPSLETVEMKVLA
jgi:nucleoid-associated protein YgaU